MRSFLSAEMMIVVVAGGSCRDKISVHFHVGGVKRQGHYPSQPGTPAAHLLLEASTQVHFRCLTDAIVGLGGIAFGHCIVDGNGFLFINDTATDLN